MSIKPTVAVIGASSNRSKYGNISVRAHLAQGYTVYPIHPSETEIEGLPVFRSLNDLPEGPLDRISMYVPPQIGLSLLDDIAKANAKEVWFNPGSENDELITKAEALGIEPIQACSIVDIGTTPAAFE